MAWRFKASKYKNAAPIVPKPEACIRDVCVGSYQTYGNNIAASAAFMAFNWEHTGSSLAILPLDDCGRKSKTMPLLHAHTDTVTDVGFSPFHDGILATASQDCLVKIWHIPEKGLEQSLTEPECTFSHKQRRVETVGFHPTADCLVHSTAVGCITLFDLTKQMEIFSNNEHPEVIQSLSWRQDGTLMVTSCKDKVVRIIDPRNGPDPIQLCADSHQSIKDSRVVWLGDQNRVLSTGFDANRIRQVIIRDVRKFTEPEKTLELDCSTGILMPLYDPDTNMLFLAGKGDTTINYMEVTDKDPFLIEGLRHTGEQTKGACLVTKRALKVMEGEVNRVLQLTSNMVIPIMYQVPRKTYRDFHSDLYPETNGYKTELVASQWMDGIDMPLPKMSLDPKKRENGEEISIVIHRGNLKELVKNLENTQIHKAVHHKNGKSELQYQLEYDRDHEPAQLVQLHPIKKTINRLQKVINNEKMMDGIDHQNNGQANGKDEMNLCSGDTENIPPPLTKNDIIRKFDNKYKTDSEKEKQSLNHENANTMPYDDDNIQNDETSSPPSAELGNTNGCNEQTPPDSAGCNNGGNNGCASPPKPLPRTSRNNSITETNATVVAAGPISIEDVAAINSPRPVARPRTNVTSYKPRLGPKPFTSNSSDVTFDKVFAVPQVPGTDIENNSTITTITTTNNTAAATTVTDSNESASPPNYDKIVTDNVIEIEIKNDIIPCAVVPPVANEKNGTTDVGKSLSTLERRKIFELNHSESSGNSTESEDKPDELKRLSANRSSIAERRRLYENRSKSVQDEKPQSPLPLLRRESTKTETDNARHSPPNSDDKTTNKKSNSTDNSTITFTKRTSTVFGKVSKYRHLKGTAGHKSTQIENVRNLSRQIPGECNGFHANHERVAVPLSGPGGKIAIYELNKPGRLPDGVIPSLVNGNNIMDFQWDPYDSSRLAVACDDGVVRFWAIENGGLEEPTNIPEKELIAHLDKIYFIRYHPLAANVLLTASYDMTIKLWDLATMKERLSMIGHNDQIFDFAWSPCGVYGATVCRDGKLRVYNPRKSCDPIREGNGPVGTRGARLTWAIDGQYIVVTGFDKVSERQITIYHAQNLSTPLNTVSLDVSPAILIPFYDEDSSTLFVTGKGDSTIYCYEITDEEPYICPLSHHRCSTLHQGLSFLSKNHCDVASVEFSKAYRLTNNTIEPLSFTVPRLKSELFQDDLFPPTRVTWLPTMTADEWYAMKDKIAEKLSLQPEGMECLSSIQPMAAIKKVEQIAPSSQFITQSDFEKSRQQKIQKSMSARLEYNAKLEQDEMEGVDENEWEE